MALVGPGASPVGSKSSSKCLPLGEHGIRNPVSVPVAAARGGPRPELPCWVEVLEQVSTWNLTWFPVNVPVAAARRGPTRSFPSWLEECNLEPGKCPRGFSARRPRPELSCWVQVLEQVSPAGSTWNLTWNPVSVPGCGDRRPPVGSKSSSKCLPLAQYVT